MTTDTETNVECVAGDATAGVILLCDHASNALPAAYGTLGLAAGALQKHIAYDIGTAGLTRRMAALLRAPTVLSRYSRLLIDLNRGEHDPTLVMRLSDGEIIPGNAHVSPDEIARRIERYYRPYHHAVAALIDSSLDAGTAPVLISIHSFTEQWRGRARPWHAGVLWDKDPRLAVPLIEALRQEAGLCVGDNQPYTGKLRGDTLNRHGTGRGLAHAIIEIRQDLIAPAAGQMAWADRLTRIIRALSADKAVWDECRRIRHFGSWTDAPI